MQPDLDDSLDDDSEDIVELGFADDDLPIAESDSEERPARYPSQETSPAAAFAVSLMATVLLMTAGLIFQAPQLFGIRDDSDLQTVVVASLDGIPFDTLVSVDVSRTPELIYPYGPPARQRETNSRNRPGGLAAFKRLSFEQKMQFPMTLRIEESFETIIKEISRRTEIPIEFHFADLRADGIQKVRIIRIDAKEQPIEAILCEALLQNNPDRAQTVGDLNQTLVYVIALDGESLMLTSRRRAAERGTLPEVFVTGQ